jgi:uncharacterized membrane protein HdeD (DUF308 family)
MNSQPWFIKIWNDGKHFDLWHVNHFLAGTLLAIVGILLGLDEVVNFMIALLAMISWEIFEIINKIYETKFNRSADVILGVLGFVLIYFLNISNSSLSYMFFLVLVVWLIMESWGFVAYKKRGGNRHYL